MRIKSWVVAGMAASVFGAAPAMAQPIVIGVSTAQTGPAAVAAEWELWGVNLAVEEINAAGGVLGRKLEILVMDNKCNPSEAVNAANKLVEAKVVAIEGSHCSSAHLASMKIIADATTDRILGIHILCAHASDMIAECAISMEFAASSEDIARSFHAHPTLPEAIKEAALAVEKRAIHI